MCILRIHPSDGYKQWMFNNFFDSVTEGVNVISRYIGFANNFSTFSSFKI